jgi:apolipoprotein N-acyltransferase
MNGIISFFVSGLIVALGQPAWMAWLAPVAAIGGYALFWHMACKIPPSKKRFFLATGWFALVQLLQLSWMTSIEFQGGYILVVYALLAVGLGLQFGVLTHFVDRIPLLASASLWALMEWSRLYVLCGFTFNPAGLALTTNLFSLQAVSLFGIFGLSFWVILTNLAAWKRRWKATIILAVCPYLLGGIQWSVHRASIDKSPILNVALVQTALLPSQKMYFPERAADFISPYEQWGRIAGLLSQISDPVDLVVLPEAAIPYTDQYPRYSPDSVRKILENAFQHRSIKNTTTVQEVSNPYWMHSLSQLMKADIIAGLDGEEDDLQYSSAFFASQGKLQRYDKQILLPLAEYLPFQSLLALTKNYGISQFFTHGKKPRLFHSKVPIATSICYEETFGYIMRQARKEGAELFVNVTNDNWYPDSKLPKQHFDIARAQAVASGTPLVRACNAGLTAAVDSLGRILAELKEWNQPAALVVKVPLCQIWTFYTFWGDQGIIFISIFFLVLSVLINRKSLLVSRLIKFTGR